jgi:hypothetical protein
LASRIWKAGMARLSGRTVGLDGVVDQQANYRQSGLRTGLERNCAVRGDWRRAAPRRMTAIITLGTLPFDAAAGV